MSLFVNITTAVTTALCGKGQLGLPSDMWVQWEGMSSKWQLPSWWSACATIDGDSTSTGRLHCQYHQASCHIFQSSPIIAHLSAAQGDKHSKLGQNGGVLSLEHGGLSVFFPHKGSLSCCWRMNGEIFTCCEAHTRVVITHKPALHDKPSKHSSHLTCINRDCLFFKFLS